DSRPHACPRALSLARCNRDPSPLPSLPTRRSSDLRSLEDVETKDAAVKGARLFSDDELQDVVVHPPIKRFLERWQPGDPAVYLRSEEHTSELQSLAYLVCRLLLEKKKNKSITSDLI